MRNVGEQGWKEEVIVRTGELSYLVVLGGVHKRKHAAMAKFRRARICNIIDKCDSCQLEK